MLKIKTSKVIDTSKVDVGDIVVFTLPSGRKSHGIVSEVEEHRLQVQGLILGRFQTVSISPGEIETCGVKIIRKHNEEEE